MCFEKMPHGPDLYWAFCKFFLPPSSLKYKYYTSTVVHEENVSYIVFAWGLGRPGNCVYQWKMFIGLLQIWKKKV